MSPELAVQPCEWPISRQIEWASIGTYAYDGKINVAKDPAHRKLELRKINPIFGPFSRLFFNVGVAERHATWVNFVEFRNPFA